MDQNILNTIPEKGTKDEIVCVVDCSSSMHRIREEATDGINQFIKEQQEVEGGANLTMIEFNTRSTVLYEQVDIREAPEYALKPNGMTALRDAIADAVTSVPDTDGKVVIVIVTDGDDTSSQRFSPGAVKELITEKQDAGWEFVFLAANQDAIATSKTYGFDPDAVVNFAANAEGATQAYDAVSTYTTSLRTKSKMAAVEDLKSKVDDSDELS